MNAGWWGDLVLYGIPACFILGFIWGGVVVFARQQDKNNDREYHS